MSLTVWKYTVPVQDVFHLTMPLGAEPLTVQGQFNEPQLWVRVNPEADTCQHRFRLSGTGHPNVGDGRYIGTFQVYSGELVFHVFYEGEVAP